MMKKTIYIDGMSCHHCVMHVTRALEALQGIQSVHVELEQGIAQVELSQDVADQQFIEAIEDVGYRVTKIEG